MVAQDQVLFYKKFTVSMFLTMRLGLALYYGKSIIMPLLFGLLLATPLLPLTSFFGRKGFNRAFSLLIPLVVSILGGTAIAFLLPTIIPRQEKQGLSY